MEKYIFQSDRLGFRHWQDADLVPLVEMGKDPVVMEFFPKTLMEQESAAMVNRINGHFEEKGYGGVDWR